MKNYALKFSFTIFLLCTVSLLKANSIAIVKAPIIDSICGKTIKYYINKVSTSQQELKVKMEIIISPSNKNINLNAEVENEGKTNFNTVIESMECELNNDLTKGYALYKGYIKQENGDTTKAFIKIEIKDHQLIISNADPEKTDNMKMFVEKWEIVKE